MLINVVFYIIFRSLMESDVLIYILSITYIIKLAMLSFMHKKCMQQLSSN